MAGLWCFQTGLQTCEIRFQSWESGLQGSLATVTMWVLGPVALNSRAWVIPLGGHCRTGVDDITGGDGVVGLRLSPSNVWLSVILLEISTALPSMMLLERWRC